MADDGVRIDTHQWERFAEIAKSDKSARKIITELRAGLRQAGNIAATAARTEVQKAPLQPGKRPVSKGLRSGIAGGIKVQVTAKGGKAITAVVKSTGSGLSEGQKKLVKAYDKPGGWRHPVFAKYGQRAGLKKAIKSSKGSNRKALRNFEKALGERDRAKAVWVTQKGRPYFDTAIMRKESVYKATVDTAIEAAADAIGNFLDQH